MNNNHWSKQAINERLFTKDYNPLIKVLKQTTIDSTKPIPVELVKELSRLRCEINELKQPMFTENGVSVMDCWEEYKFTGLNNVDYVNYNYYDKEEVNEPY
jgi:hypothetical protein